MGRHRLRRELVVPVVSNDLINRVGINFVHEVREKTGMPPEEVVKAYVIAREISGMRDLWAEIEALDNKVPAQLQARMLVECGRLVERETVWFLRERSEEHTSELQSLMRRSYAVFCLKKKIQE